MKCICTLKCGYERGIIVLYAYCISMTKCAQFTYKKYILSNFQKSKLNKGGCYVNVHYTQQWHNGIRIVTLEKNEYVKKVINFRK